MVPSAVPLPSAEASSSTSGPVRFPPAAQVAFCRRYMAWAPAETPEASTRYSTLSAACASVAAPVAADPPEERSVASALVTLLDDDAARVAAGVEAVESAALAGGGLDSPSPPQPAITDRTTVRTAKGRARGALICMLALRFQERGPDGSAESRMYI